MARGDVFVIGDRVEYRSSYKAAVRYGTIRSFAPMAVVVVFDDGREQTIRASAAHLHLAAVEVYQL